MFRRTVFCLINYIVIDVTKSRSSRQEVFCKKGILGNFAKFTGKHLCQVLFFNKVVGLRPANFIEKETLAQVFSCGICEISKSTFFTEHLRWLLQFLLERKKSILNSSVRKYMFYQHETSSLKTPLTPKKKQQQYISKWFHFFIQSLLFQTEHNRTYSFEREAVLMSTWSR